MYVYTCVFFSERVAHWSAGRVAAAAAKRFSAGTTHARAPAAGQTRSLDAALFQGARPRRLCSTHDGSEFA